MVKRLAVVVKKRVQDDVTDWPEEELRRRAAPPAMALHPWAKEELAEESDDEDSDAGMADDGELGGDESDVDCGGGCDPCMPGQLCQTDADCLSTHECLEGSGNSTAICISLQYNYIFWVFSVFSDFITLYNYIFFFVFVFI